MIHEVYVNGLAKEEEFNKEAITNNTHLTNSLEKLLDKKVQIFYVLLMLLEI